MKSPLRNEIIKVVFVPHNFMNIKDKDHPCFGGMAGSSTVTFYAATTKGTPVLTKDEQEFFEHEFGLPEGSLGVNVKTDNFWKGQTNNFNSVTIPKTGLILDLNKVEDYIKYKILLSHKNVIANGLTVQQAMKSGYQYQFTMVSEKALQKEETESANAAYEAFEKLRNMYNNANTLNYVLSKITGQTYSFDSKIESLRAGIIREIQNNAPKVVELFKKDNLDKYVTLFVAERMGIIISRDGVYYEAATGKPLTSNKDIGEGATAKSLAKPENEKVYSELINSIKEKDNE